MRNLKRALSLALAAVMLIGMMVVGASAASYNDFSDREEIVNKDAVSMLTTLGVIDGKPDGSFAPTEGVDRAMMAKMISVIMNQGVDNGTLYENSPSGLTDIASSWAKGHINFCYTTGIIAGRGNGKFDPTAGVTGSEAAKMLLVAAGYDPAIEGLVGTDWEMNTNALASKLGIFRNFNAPVTEPLTRDNAALLIYNALDIEMIESYTQNGYPIAHDDHRTILSFAYGVYKVEGVVIANEWAVLDQTGSEAALRTGKTTLDNVKIYGSSTSSTSAGEDFEAVKEPVTFNVTTPVDMLGKTVTMYIEKTTILSNSKVKGVSTNDEVNVINTTVDTQDTVTDYLKGTGVAVKNNETEYYVNYGYCKNGADGAIDAINEYANLINGTDDDKFNLNGIEVEVIDNDDDGVAEYVLYTLETLSEVNRYNEKNETITFHVPQHNNSGKMLNKSETKTVDFEDVVFEDEVATDDLILYVEYGGRTYISLPEIVTGTMTRVDRDKDNELYITVDGEKYYQSYIVDAASMTDVELTHFDIDNANKTPGFETAYDFILGSNGKHVVAVRPAEEVVTDYALVLGSAWTQNALDKSGQVKVLLTDGTEETYYINWKKSQDAFEHVDTIDDTNVSSMSNEQKLELYLGSRDVHNSGSIYKVDAAKGSIITYGLSDDKVLTIKSVLQGNQFKSGSIEIVDNVNEQTTAGVADDTTVIFSDRDDTNGDDCTMQYTAPNGYTNGKGSISVKGKNNSYTKNYAVDLNTVAFYYSTEQDDEGNEVVKYGVATGWDDMSDVANNTHVQVYPVLTKTTNDTYTASNLADVILFEAAPATTTSKYMLVLDANGQSKGTWNLTVVFEDGVVKEITVDDDDLGDFDPDVKADFMKAYTYKENADETYSVGTEGKLKAQAYRLDNGTIGFDKNNTPNVGNDDTYYALSGTAKVWDVTDVDSAEDTAIESKFSSTRVNAVIVEDERGVIRTAWFWDIPNNPSVPGGVDGFNPYITENAFGDYELYWHDNMPSSTKVRELAGKYFGVKITRSQFDRSAGVWEVTTESGDVIEIIPVQVFRITYNGKVVDYIRTGDVDGVDFTTSKSYQEAGANAVIINKDAVVAGDKDGGVNVTGNTANYTWAGIASDVDLVDAFKVALTGVGANAKLNGTTKGVSNGNFVADGAEVTLSGATLGQIYTVEIDGKTTDLSGEEYTMNGKAVTFKVRSNSISDVNDLKDAFKTQDNVVFDGSSMGRSSTAVVPQDKTLTLKSVHSTNALTVMLGEGATLNLKGISGSINTGMLVVDAEPGATIIAPNGTILGSDTSLVDGNLHFEANVAGGMDITSNNAVVYVNSNFVIGTPDEVTFSGTAKFEGKKDVELYFQTPTVTYTSTENNFYDDTTDKVADGPDGGTTYVWKTFKVGDESVTGWVKK